MPVHENVVAQYKREDFDVFLREIEELSHSPELVSPLRIASPPFNVICDTIHLAWIRQDLSAKIKEKQPKNIMVMAMLHTAHFGKSSLWTIDEGIPTLMNESSVLITPSNQSRSAEIAHHVKQAKQACYYGDLKAKESPDGGLIVNPEDLLNWAENNDVPVNSEIARAIRDKRLGHIPPKSNKGWQSRQHETQEIYKEWQEAALDLKQKNPSLSKSAVAAKIALSDIGKGRDSETIRKNIHI